MKKFLLKIAVFCFILSGTYFYFINKLSKGYVDEYYQKFTQEADGLIIGMSRGQRGIAPDILEKELYGTTKNKTIVNFALDGYQSPYGETYLHGIRKKLKKNTEDGIFILSVTPGSFNTTKGINKDKILEMDKKTIIGKLNNFTSAPNYDYIMNCYAQSLYNSIYSTNSWDNMVTHSNGWNEVKPVGKSKEITEKDMENWKSVIINYYKETIRNETFSSYRWNSFVKTMVFLKKKGNVFVVRLPADPDLIKMENNYSKKFNKQFDSIAKKYNVHYLDYSGQSKSYKTYDGSHLLSESAKRFTKILCKDIKNILNQHIETP